MKLKTVAMTGVLSLAGLGLIGAGAHAAFTTSTASSQEINAGTPSLVTWAANATNGCTTQTIATENPTTCDQVTLTPGTVGSTFDEPSAIGVANIGDIAVNLTSFGLSDSDGPSAAGANLSLQQGIGLCINGVYNGLLHAYPNFNTGTNSVTPVALGIGANTTYYVDLYAGGTSTNCGGSEPALPEGAVGGSDTVTITVGYTG
jgi:hypothetical protein